MFVHANPGVQYCRNVLAGSWEAIEANDFLAAFPELNVPSNVPSNVRAKRNLAVLAPSEGAALEPGAERLHNHPLGDLYRAGPIAGCGAFPATVVVSCAVRLSRVGAQKLHFAVNNQQSRQRHMAMALYCYGLRPCVRRQ